MPLRRPRVSRLQLFYAVVLAALMVGGSLALDRKGTLVKATIAGKRERIVVGFEPLGVWDRYYEVLAAFGRPDGGHSEAVVRVPAARYDALGAGDSLSVRYMPQFPALARTSDRSTASVLRELGQVILGRLPVLSWLAVGGAALWIAARVGSISVIGVAVVWIAAAWPMFFTPESRDGPRLTEQIAEVRHVTLVDRSPAQIPQSRRWVPEFDRRLNVPYQVVELKIARSGQDTVLAVDAVDSGSVSGLEPGSRHAVRFDPAAPREAQLAGGSRRFAVANKYHFFVPIIGCAFIGTLGALGYHSRRRAEEESRQEARLTTEANLPLHNDSGIIHEGGA